MKKGVTMIELIFVIVIFGILAAVAIPRLAATRDDAEVAKAATNLSTIVSDLGAYYTSQGDWDNGGIAKMTNVVTAPGGTVNEVELTSAGKKCIKVTLNTTGNATLTISNGTDNTAAICQSVLANTSVAKMMSNPIDVKGKAIKF